MATNIEKREFHLYKAVLKEAGLEDVEIGDIFITTSDYSPVAKITDIRIDNDLKKEHPDDPNYYIIIYYDRLKESVSGSKWEGDTSTLRSFNEYFISRGKKLEKGKDFDEYLKEAQKVISGEVGIESYDDKSNAISDETAIIARASKDGLIAIQKELELKRHKAELIRRFVMLEMERRKRALEDIRNKLGDIVSSYQKKIQKIMKVITTIELYLGIHEELFQIQDGQKADRETPISFRQAVLYMDEEVGRWKEGGLDFTNIEWFDNWLVENDNYKNLIPETKGMVVFRPRRHDKDYGVNDWYSRRMNDNNKLRTYLLIRNGECLYRVYTENIVILPRLFPRRTELQELIDNVGDSSHKIDDFDDLLYQYKKRALLMQGLIDRSDIFHPLPADKINIFNLHEVEGKVNFIYDDEETLPTGRKTFKDWKDDINSKIKHGSRIFVTGFWEGKAQDRIYYYCNEYSTPAMPERGIYEVEEYFNLKHAWISESQLADYKVLWEKKNLDFEIIDTHENKYCINYNRKNSEESPIYENGYWVKAHYPELTILYNPKDTVYGSWGNDYIGERKKRIRYRIYPHDSGILNYDKISLDEVDFYLTSRVDRPNYLSMMPILEEIKEHRIKEMELEKAFGRMIYERIKAVFGNEDELIKLIQEGIDWFKYKNNLKRPITKDDTKALRMIERRIKTIIKNTPSCKL